jgi:MoaD family protein
VEPLGRRVVRVSVRMMGSLREASGRSEEELNLTGDVDVSSAIRELVEEHGKAFKEVLLDPLSQNLTIKTLILVNGVEINNIKGIDTPLDDGDHIVLIPVTHGG